MFELMNEIFSILEEFNRPVVSYLDAGLQESFIYSEFEKLDLSPSKEMVEMYKWRNGTKYPQGVVLDDIYFFPGYYFFSLYDAIAQYLAMRDDSRWNKDWFPIFANGGGDFYAVDLALSDGSRAPILRFFVGENRVLSEYRNLMFMFSAVLECFKSGVIFVSDEGYLDMDDIRFIEISQQYNSDEQVH
ncbi:SMI1/KNR4 family protein [Synechococcus sp. PCC 7336]|uniref:SMI1/KNR4 family protein n=1 Tax=Synechococcus sp. PCC 7336 TaxID=195250 RepID=UPI00037C070C|nr:SMI1/KNR4 family protein [Synechococcus sp. PCC 7336]